MAQPNSGVLVNATVNVLSGSAITVVSVVVTFPDNSTTTYVLNNGVTALGSGVYQLSYTTKGAGNNSEIWTFTAADGTVGSFRNFTEVAY